MNGNEYINNMIFRVKFGNENDFKILWNSNKEILDSVYFSFCKFNKILLNRRIEIYHFMYSWFWDCINEYDFIENELFCYNLKNKIIKNLNKYLIDNCHIQKKQIPDKTYVLSNIRKEKYKKNKNLYNALKSLTPKQLQSIWFYFYENKTLDDTSKIIGIKKRSLVDRLEMSYKKIANIAIGIKVNNKKMFSEKTYSIPI